MTLVASGSRRRLAARAGAFTMQRSSREEKAMSEARQPDGGGRQRVLVVGLGTMGVSHARAYQAIDGFDLVGLCTRNAAERRDLDAEFAGVPRFERLGEALAALKPDAVAIAAYTEHHAPMALEALATGAHVFCEKPLADALAAAEKIVATARAAGKALLVGYILRVHPSWTRFVEIGRTLGKPLVMRMNLNQQSSGSFWEVHKNLMKSTSPIVDCGVHYVDVMCQVTRAKPVAVHAVGARLTDEIAPTMVNYGHLHIVFDDGSVGWYEAGWGPMMSETAFFVKDMIGPKGCVSIVAKETAGSGVKSSDHDAHTRTNALRIHHAALDAEGHFTAPDTMQSTGDEPGHQELCEREQRLFLRAIRGEVDLADHWADAINSLRIVFAAAESIRTGQVVRL
jgi:predicted dehydrogenase